MTNKLLIISQLGNKTTGLGKAVNDFLDDAKKKLGEENVGAVDIINNRKFFFHLLKILTSNYQIYYFTPAGSLFGNIRDVIYLSLIIMKKKKLVLHFHNNNFGNIIRSNPISYHINKWILRKTNRIILLGNKHKKMFEGINNLNFEIVSNSIDDELFVSEAEYNQKQGNNIIYFSNMITEKGYNLVLEVAEILKDTSYHFTFSGKFFDENLKNEFLSRISNLQNVTYIDGVYGRDKQTLLKKMDIFILPTQYKDETLPISMLEAMANCLFIIITDKGVISEVLISKTSHLLNLPTSQEIVEAIKNVPRDLEYSDFEIEKIMTRHSKENILNNLLLKVLEV